MTTILDGKKLSEEIKKDISDRLDSANKKPTLPAVLVGEDPASKAYLNLKEKDCSQVGIEFKRHHLSGDSSLREVIDLIEELNNDKDIDGIIVQLPVPEHLDLYNIMETIDPKKDVDGLTPYNIGKLWTGDYDLYNDLVPCTPKGIMELLDNYEISIEGKEVVIVNRSNLVGKPLAKLMLDRDATVTICHSNTEDIGKHTRDADILVSAVGGRPNFVVTEDMVKEGSVVVDVGMNHMEDGLYGDVEFDEVKENTSYITPVPGGVGPMTRVTLLENTVVAAGVKS